MTSSQKFGAMILVIVFGTIFGATVVALGFWPAALVWLGSIVLSALIVLGIHLVSEGQS